VSADAIERALLAYLAARTGADGAGFSRGDALSRLRETDLDAQALAECDRVLRALERARYGGQMPTPDEIRTLLAQFERSAAVAGGVR
jgi:hypothetical protein